ncbi:GCD1 Nucleoside-diphosphate-sugar pyrophosphorylase involved in lipopolysaccharide biosynthesis/translation initiation factor 2B, gamma/epsilon subunits (eIF-2Bgamma/eIF-2Bepsilon) [Candidatus Nanopelagicaceae bacterium]
MKALILAGGMGTRLREETEFKPKPMVEIGGRPIIWHIMKNLSNQGISEFVVALGYKGDVIRDFFLNYSIMQNDFSVDLSSGTRLIIGDSSSEKWNVTLVETGSNTMTGGRILRCQHALGEEFLCTYGDGLADISISNLLDFHNKHTGVATVTAATPPSRFGRIAIQDSGLVDSFIEKPKEIDWVNAGFFIFRKEIFHFLSDDAVLEKEPLEKLSSQSKLYAYKHRGFWQPMDTLRESELLNVLWDENRAPWKNW